MTTSGGGSSSPVPGCPSAATAPGTSHCSATNLLGRRERARRGGYPSQVAARQARDAFLAGTAADRTAEGWTVERWLRHWLDNRTHIRETTRFHYTRDVNNVLIPHLGRYRLAGLDAPLLRTVFAAIAGTRNNKGRCVLSRRKRLDAHLTDKITHLHAVSKGTYGAPRIHADLTDAGMRHGRKRVARLMRTAGLAGKSPRRWRVTTTPDPNAGKRPDLVDRDFTTDPATIDTRWCGDIT